MAKFNAEGEETVGSRSGRPGPTERCLRAVTRQVETHLRCTAADVVEPLMSVAAQLSGIYIHWATMEE